MTERWKRRLAWIVVAVIAADWWTKFLVLNRVALGERIAVLRDWLYIVRIENRGIAFGVLNDGAIAWQTPVLVLVACVVLVPIVRLGRELTGPLPRAGLALLVGGALGNLGDRLVNGGVTDFVAVTMFPYVFNVADIAITAGGMLLLFAMLRTHDAANGSHA